MPWTIISTAVTSSLWRGIFPGCPCWNSYWLRLGRLDGGLSWRATMVMCWIIKAFSAGLRGRATVTAVPINRRKPMKFLSRDIGWAQHWEAASSLLAARKTVVRGIGAAISAGKRPALAGASAARRKKPGLRGTKALRLGTKADAPYDGPYPCCWRASIDFRL